MNKQEVREQVRGLWQLVELANAVAEGDASETTIEAYEAAIRNDAEMAVEALGLMYTEEKLTEERLAEHKRQIGARKDAAKVRQGWAKAQILAILEATGRRSVKAPTATISASPGRERFVCDLDPETAPDEYVRTVRQIDKEAVRAAVKGGAQVEGARFERGEPVVTVGAK